jgi:hypothetical protein
MNMTMTTHTLVHCRSRCAPRRVARARPGIGARITAYSLALAALLLMLNGEVWLLQGPSDAPDELTVATCAIDAVDPDASLVKACGQRPMNVDKETL